MLCKYNFAVCLNESTSIKFGKNNEIITGIDVFYFGTSRAKPRRYLRTINCYSLITIVEGSESIEHYLHKILIITHMLLIMYGYNLILRSLKVVLSVYLYYFNPRWTNPIVHSLRATRAATTRRKGVEVSLLTKVWSNCSYTTDHHIVVFTLDNWWKPMSPYNGI